MEYIALAARICLCLVFFNAAISHLTDFSGFVETISGQGLPLAGLLAVGTIFFQLLGAMSLLLGYKTKIGSILLIIGGFLGWLSWLGIHLYYLPGLSNRFKVLGAWLKDYLFRDRSVRQVYQMIPTESKE